MIAQMGKKCHILLILVGIIGMVWRNVPYSFAKPSNNTEDLLRTICNTFEKSLKRTYQGRGLSRVLIFSEVVPSQEITKDYDTGETTLIKPRGTKIETTEQKFLVDFAFKGEASLSEFYEIKENGDKGKFLSANINTSDMRFLYDAKRSNAARLPTTQPIKYRSMGYDFHPETLTRIYQMPFVRQMDIFLKYTRAIETHYNVDGLLEVKLEGDKNDNLYHSRTLVLDPQADFRPVKFKSVSEINRSGSMVEVHYQANWERYTSTWYITNLTYEESRKFKGELPTKYRVEIEVLNFDPDTEVKDSVFDFKNLDIPKGTPMYDRIEGVEYKWGEEEKAEKIEIAK